MKLYGYWRSSATWRVRIGLGLKGLAANCEIVPVDLRSAGGGEQRSEAHGARNPMAQVPVLELDDGRLLTQSLAILAWLDAAHPSPPLWPADPWPRARAMEIAEIINAGVQPLQNLSLLQHIKALGGDPEGWSREVIGRGLAACEAKADPTGPFLVGEEPSVADICLVPQMHNARLFGLDLAAFPALLRAEAACAALPAFLDARPERQPDAPAPH